mgnify:CR=1 FL=1
MLDKFKPCFVFGLSSTQTTYTFYFSGTRIKTRKRNIAAPLDPSSFADAIVEVYLQHEGDLVYLLECHKFLGLIP